jgi:hypothetical protein
LVLREVGHGVEVGRFRGPDRHVVVLLSRVMSRFPCPAR